MRLTLEEYKSLRASVESLEREIVVSRADEELSGLSVLDADASIAEIRSKLRKARPIMRRKSVKKLSDVKTPRLVYSTEQECWVSV